MSHLPLPQCPEDIGLHFHLLTRDQPKIKDAPTFSYFTPPPTDYDPKKRTIVTVHGWMSEANIDWMKKIVEGGPVSPFDANVIVVDWKKGAKKVYYPNSAANVRTV